MVFLQSALMLASATAALVSAKDITSRCVASNIEFPHIPGTQIDEIIAHPVKNQIFTASEAQSGDSFNATLDFCNVTISYGHLNWYDNVKVTIWLPLKDWNGRLAGIGGGGFASVYSFNRNVPAVVNGYVAVATDAGHANQPFDASSWALDASSRVNFFLTQNFFAISEYEASIIAKKVIKDMYGQKPKYSYWDGCSTGGRQGFMLAQRYPDAYDGILAGSPAINWATFVPGMYYPQFVMNQLEHYPSLCKLSAFVNSSISACDALDGVTDGIVSAPQKCDFDPDSIVGHSFTCDGESVTVTAQDAEVVRQIWAGPKYADGSQIWYGIPKGSELKVLANSTCEGDKCMGVPYGIASSWINLFVLQDFSYNLTALPPSGFEAIMANSISAYKYVTSTDDPDLSAFKKSGGKLLHWHGTADNQIFEPGSQNYYQRVEAKDPKVRDFYRYFQAPGATHCSNELGLFPDGTFSVLVDWVERGVAPDYLRATTADGKYHRNLCPYPLVPAFQHGDVTKAGSYRCEKSFT